MCAACSYIQKWDPSNPAPQQGLDLQKMSMAELYKYYALNEMTVDFVGHALALHTNDNYIHQPAAATCEKIKLYYTSLTRFEGTKSPYIYPLYGLGELPRVRHSLYRLLLAY